MIIWFTGQAGSGKTTLAKRLEEILKNEGTAIISIDGDELREVYHNFDYSEIGRRRNVEIASTTALLLAKKGYDVIVSLISPFRDQREVVKEKHLTLEIYCDAGDTDRKEEFKFDNYESPKSDFLQLNTKDWTVDECISVIISKMKYLKLIQEL